MDFTQVPALQTAAELSAEQETAITEQIETRLRDLHTALPGVIVSFNSAKQTAVVQLAIRRVFVLQDPGQPAVVSQVNLAPCVDVPVLFPGGGGFFLTFPVAEGDECLVLFSERAIDFWFQNGGQQLPSEYRLHDLSDAIALVGLNSQPNVLADFNASACQLRTRDGSTFIQVAAGTITLKGNVIVTGSITASEDVTAEGISLKSHVHGEVETGADETGVPV
jgi:hypothetical protein